MSLFSSLGRRLRMLLRGGRADRALDEEMRLHMALRQERLQAEGMSGEDAAAAARIRFGNPLQLREESIDAWGWRWLEQLTQDIRFGVRTLRRSPGFTATVVVTLALATGASTSIFGIVYGVLLRPLPFATPDRLVQIYGRNFASDRGRTTPDPVLGPVGTLELAEFAAQSTTFDGFVAYDFGTRHLDGPDGPERLTAVSADRGFFALLGVAPVVGRTFEPEDPMDVVVISGRLWQRRFGSDPSIVGKAVVLDQRPATVIGVMPEAFQFPYSAASLMDGALPESRTDVWVPAPPLQPIPGVPRRRARVTARLKPDVTLDAAAAELRVIAARVEEQHYAGRDIRVGVRAVPLADEVIAPVRRSLWILFAAVGLVLAAACANVANLLMARMTVRVSEVTTRTALGASRLRLARQFLAEGLLLSLAGGVLGLFVAHWGTELLLALGAAKIPRAHEVTTTDWQAFAFLLIACIAMAVVFGVAPAQTALRAESQLAKELGRATMGRTYGRLRDALVVVEVALAFILAIGAALVVREAIRLKNTPAGVTTENVLTLHLTPRTEARDYYDIEQRVAALPRVRAAGFTQLIPLQNWGWKADFTIRGRLQEGRPIAGLRYVTPGYFRAMGIPILRGRELTEFDEQGAPRVIVINDALARRYFANENPVGADLDRGTIVGVVGDVRQAGLNQPAEPEIFYPAAQNVTMATDIGMSLIVRTDGPPEPLIGLVRGAVREVNPRLAIFNVKTMEQVLADSLWELNLYQWLIGLFASLVVVLAGVGLFGVMSYTVTSRAREFAVRLALGSDPGRLAKRVLGRGAVLTAVGLLAGAILTEEAFLVLGNLPMAGRPDAFVYVLVAVGLFAIALTACAIPAIRVAGVNPVIALREG